MKAPAWLAHRYERTSVTQSNRTPGIRSCNAAILRPFRLLDQHKMLSFVATQVLHGSSASAQEAAPVVPNDPVEDRAPFGQALERADFVSAHEAAVACHICCEDCYEASAD
jgi:hypothetical protein